MDAKVTRSKAPAPSKMGFPWRSIQETYRFAVSRKGSGATSSADSRFLAIAADRCCRQKPTSQQGCAAALVFLLGLASSPARADSDEWQVQAGPSWGILQSGDGVAHAAGADASFWLGLAGASWLFLSAGGNHFFGDDAFTRFEATGGLVFAFDVFRTVPFLELGVGMEMVDGDPAPIVRGGIGADYLVSKNFGLGAVFRYYPLVERGDHLFSFGLRVVFRDDL